MKTYQLMDEVLRVLNNAYSNRYPTYKSPSGDTVNERTPEQEFLAPWEALRLFPNFIFDDYPLDLVFQHLNSEGLISPSSDGAKYAITMKGRLFIEMGGFENDQTNITATATRNRNSYRLNWILAFGAVGVIAMEVIKISIDKNENYSIHAMNLVTGVFVFLFGLTGGIILSIVCQLILSRKE